MAAQNKRNRMGYLLALAAVALVLVGILLALQPAGTPLSLLIRGAGLLGYLAVFLAIASAAYLTELVRFFGRPFIKVHHSIAATGLALITLHALGVATRAGSLAVFVPDAGSPLAFLATGGRLAWFLIVAAALVAAARASIGRQWRLLHGLTYLAFWLATAHAILLGTDVQAMVTRVIAVVLALAVVAIFTLKRRRMGKRPAGRRRS